MTKAKRDIHQEITDQIIEKLEAGTAPWQRDWKGGHGVLTMPRRSTGQLYQGVNVLLLWMASEERGYIANDWYTFKQAKDLGAMVRKGERGTRVIYYSTFERENAVTGETDQIPFVKAYTVFNAQQIEGLPEGRAFNTATVDTGARPIEALETFYGSIGAKIINDGANPHYKPSADTIHMPLVQQFNTAESYYGTLAHELIHWTGHQSRLDRLKKFGKKTDYAFEELVAELGACFTTAQSGGQIRDVDSSASYIASWLQCLRNDKKFIFRAASAAQKATNFLIERAATKTETHAIAAE